MAARFWLRYGETMNETARLADVCRYIEAHSDEPLPLERLAARANLSKYHFARRFKALVGVTPRQYIAAARLQRFKGKLRGSGSVEAALYDAGYGSSSRVYENAAHNLGMTPAQYRRGGEGVAISYAVMQTPLGTMMIGATDRGICFAQFGESESQLLERLRREYARATAVPMSEPFHPEYAGWVQAIQGYLSGERTSLDLPLDVTGTAFQLRVWKYLQSIPYGAVLSYGEIAKALGKPTASRAVGSAIGRNAVALVIPCHRVIRGSGEIGEYKWGSARKRTLLDLERAANA
jgi:AraC family transcriptional regulator of adaptative response/methylated-DNA-[protein]-cysteine methyltransferase